MPAGAGETLLATLFADVHYSFTHYRAPAKPQHHRFARQSYVYLYHAPSEQHARLEVANHAGTPAQDACSGPLNLASLRYSYLQPALFTLDIDVDALPDHTTWCLPAYDPSNGQKYMYKIHALDIYLWTEKDAAAFLAHIQSIMPPDKLHLRHVPAAKTLHAEHRDSMSPVVARLEKTALGSPYPPRTGSGLSSASVPALPPPATSQSSPAPYNPAAPAAPEPVTYREKTPPPPDDGTGTGLAAAANYEAAPPTQYATQPHQFGQQNAYFSGPPTAVRQSPSTSLPGPPPRQPSFGPLAAATIPTSSPAPGASAAQYAACPQQSQYTGLPPALSAPPAYASPLQSPGIPPPPPPIQQSSIPVGGYSDYSYSSAPASSGDRNAHGAYTGDLHGQMYRPTETETKSKKQQPPASTATGERHQLQDGVNKFEGKVGKYLNKLDKLW